MKILHLATDDKFIDHAFRVFEKVYPGLNDVFVFTNKTPLTYVKLKPNRVVVKRSGFFYKKPKLTRDVYNKYDLIIFHGLTDTTFPEISNISHNIPTVWLGWGVDYYTDFLAHIRLYMGVTEEIYNTLIANKPKTKLAKFIKGLIRAIRPNGRKVRAIERITLFSPVLPQEYEMVKAARIWECFPEFASWNYGTLEDNLIKGFEGESVTDNAILVGNSATYTSNHAEIFDLLHKLKVSDRQVIAPLSYGDPQLAKKLTSIGKKYFSQEFEPLMEFMPIQDYVATIKKCGYVIMNHVRQQAVGNIVIMLYLGARVFVRQENPVYGFFKNSGVVISTVQELEVQPELLNSPLTAQERASNRAIVSDYWGRERAYERTRKLVEVAFSAKGVKSPALIAGTYK